jgi:voltage-gated potassium channel Kch
MTAFGMAREYLSTELWGGVFRTRNWIAVGFGLLAIGFGIWGFYRCDLANTVCYAETFPDKLFRTIDLIRLSTHYTIGHDPWQLVLAQLMMPLALLIGAIRLFVHNLRRDFRVVRVRGMRGHVVVCGLGDTGRHIAEQLADAGHRVVAISRDNKDVNSLACERRGIVVLQGDGMESTLLRVAGLRHAKSVFIACGSDAVNIEIGLRADGVTLPRPGREPLKIWVELRNDWLYDTILTHRARVNVGGSAQFRLFNLNANAARLLLRSDSFHRAASRAAHANPHLVVIGQGQTLSEVIVQAAQGNFAVPGRRLGVTLLGENAQATLGAMLVKYPGLPDCIDIHAADCKLDDAGGAGVAKAVADANPFAVVADLQDEIATMKLALRLRRGMDVLDCQAVPVFVRVWQQRKLGDFLHGLEKDSPLSDRLAVFGDLASLTGPAQLLEESIDLLAISAHEAYRQSSAGAEIPGWNDLSEQAKQSNRAFADHIPVKLSEIGHNKALDQDEIERLARMEHWRWSLALKLKGWRHGERDEIRKRHPLLKDWEELDEPSREMNRQMVRRIPGIVKSV